MRQWSGGLLHDNNVVALTGTSRRQKVLPRIEHNHEDEKEAEPFASQGHHTEMQGNSSSQRKSMVFTEDERASQTSKCVYSYEDRYMFNRIISGTDLLFDSHFESGNLCQAFRKGGCDHQRSNFTEYDLTLHHDVHSVGHTQWFYFSVSNMVANTSVKFNIGNFTKPTSLFNGGMKPLIYSEKKGKWCRCGENISYSRSKRMKSKRNVYILTFTHKFAESDDKCYFAYSYPYNYSDLQDYLQSLQCNKIRSKTFRRSLLSLTLGGNRCDLLTITEPTSSLTELQQRKGILISARVHPGETVASWICKGVVDFLTSDNDCAKALRKAFVFKVIPMLNPDGVINGNYRTSLSGVDLNRRWDNPHKLHHPTIFQTKAMMRKFQETRDVIVCCDIHGHSRREGLFMYGCPKNWNNRTHLTPHTIPTLFDNQSEFFSLHRCTFRVQGCKASTMRVVMNKEFDIESSYTLESSLSGYKGYHFSIHDLTQMGEDFCHALYDLHLLLKQKSESFVNTQTFDFSTNQTQNDRINSRRCTTICTNEKSHNSDDSGGSDSNPSEDNMSESEALQLLRSKTKIPSLKRKKKKKSRKVKTKDRKTTKTTNKRDYSYDDKKPTHRVLRSCSVVQLGGSPLSSEVNLRRCASFTGGVSKKNTPPKQRTSLKSLVFPLGP